MRIPTMTRTAHGTSTICLIVLWLIFGYGSNPCAQPAGSADSTLRIAFHDDQFLRFPAEDAKAATKVWSDRFLISRGWYDKTEVAIYDDMHSIAGDFVAGRIDICSIPSLSFLQWKDDLAAEPWSVHTRNGEDSMRYVLAVNADGDFHSVDALRGKSVIIAPEDKGLIPETWLDVLLLRRGLGTRAEFFSDVRRVNKPERAALPVFFGKADACLLQSDSLSLLSELNPQVKQRIRVLEISPNFIIGLLVVRTDLDEGQKSLLTENLLAMAQSIEGQQILNLYHVDHIELYTEETLSSVMSLVAEYEMLAGHPVPTTDPSPKIGQLP